MSPLKLWLLELELKACFDPENTRVEFVKGLHERDLLYHFDDDAHDCLAGKVDSQEGDLINKLRDMLYGDGDKIFQIAGECIDMGWESNND